MNDFNLEDIDHSAIITSQIALITMNILSFITDSFLLITLSTLIMALGILRKKPAFGFVYSVFLQPVGLVKTKILRDNHQPHHFAQIVGTLFMGLGTLFFFLEFALIGWVFIGVVTTLAALNAFGGFCVGCAVYYWLGRLKIAGFGQEPPQGSIPGQRPKG